MDSKEEGIIMINGAESSLVSEVKEKKYQEPRLFYLKASVHNQEY